MNKIFYESEFTSAGARANANSKKYAGKSDSFIFTVSNLTSTFISHKLSHHNIL